jgi:phosphatidylinositol alpha-1,6-mannosyltransferase
MIDRLKSELSLGTGPILLTVARLVRRKGIDQVLRCIPDLVRKHPGLQYVVAGEGPEKVDLLQLSSDLLIEEHVRFLGLTEESTKWALYSMCDLFIMPNRLLNGEDWEGFGIVFMEAALCGKPAIGGRNGGVPEAIEDCVTGLLVDSEKVDSIRDTVLLLLDNAESRGRMGLRARERGEEKFNWLAIAEAFQKRLPGR